MAWKKKRRQRLQRLGIRMASDGLATKMAETDHDYRDSDVLEGRVDMGWFEMGDEGIGMILACALDQEEEDSGVVLRLASNDEEKLMTKEVEFECGDEQRRSDWMDGERPTIGHGTDAKRERKDLEEGESEEWNWDTMDLDRTRRRTTTSVATARDRSDWMDGERRLDMEWMRRGSERTRSRTNDSREIRMARLDSNSEERKKANELELRSCERIRMGRRRRSKAMRRTIGGEKEAMVSMDGSRETMKQTDGMGRKRMDGAGSNGEERRLDLEWSESDGER
ncbi:hypothetical protein GCK72_017053 [Caenorhabditis remanei]|uniref:Uncharacterized protein n=1 Tax=Caenorhabditis remanei TaxID=31234 RepID=A0A6A5G6T9_CAERE|nr:hypothetical protein GCK72_017053 [Caenorhabditis remanei]KAF1750503.1 hypothetical protein GCK72_017053 [Caenorhabditis remanei]